MPVFALFGEGGFDSETTHLLGRAFDAAWERAEASGALTDETKTKVTRERLAKRIVELARRGERDHHRLVESALEHVLAPQTPGPWISGQARTA
jgi:hypothetical protein